MEFFNLGFFSFTICFSVISSEHYTVMTGTLAGFIRGQMAPSRIQCSFLCSKDPQCTGFMYTDGTCHLAAFPDPGGRLFPHLYIMDVPICEHGTLTGTKGNFSCTCDAGYTGSECDVDIDECISNPCQNGGTCNDSVNGYSCTCRIDYEGNHCQHE